MAASPYPPAETLLVKTRRQLVFLPGGSFDMGDWGNEHGLPYDGDKNARPLHKVTLTGFAIMAFKVTYEDFDAFTDAKAMPRINMDTMGVKARSPRKPAGVSWFGAKAYCQWLGELSGLPFDLPTEAQWEYAARSGGKRLLFATDNGRIDKARNYPDSAKLKDERTPDVGTYPANPAGLFGMLDHYASEWVNDWYDPSYYKRSPELDPQGPQEGRPAQENHPELGPAKVIRGHASPGNSPAFGGFVFSRGSKEPKESRPDFKDDFSGYSGWSTDQFRCALNSPTPQKR